MPYAAGVPFNLDYRPMVGGSLYDPVDNGGAVTRLRLFTTAARTDPPVVDVGPAVKIASALYRFAVPALAEATYYAIITWKATGTSALFDDRDDTVTVVALGGGVGVATDDDIARLRVLIGTDARTDDQLRALLDAAPVCVAADDTTSADVYGVGADIWEERAFAVASTTDAAGAKSKKIGDASVTYAEADGGVKSRLAIAARLRRRSCNSATRTRTINVAPPASADIDRLRLLDHLDYGDPYDRSVMVNAAEPAD